MLLFVASFGFSLWVHSDTLAVPVSFALTAVALTLVSPLPSPPAILRAASLGLLTGVGFQLATPVLGYYFSFL